VRSLFGLCLCLGLGPGLALGDEAGFELVRGAAPLVKVRQIAAVSLSVVPHAGQRLLADGPVLVRLRGDGVKPARPLYRRDDAVDPRADVPRFELSFTPERAGTARLEAECTFYLCRDERCRPVETAVSWTFEVAK
jgi:hypothetical protein